MAQLLTPELIEQTVSDVLTYELKEIFKAKGPIRINAVFYHQQSLANLVLMCNLGIKTTRLSRITGAIRNIIDPGRKVEIPKTLEISGYGVDRNEDLLELGVISTKNGTGVLDFKALYSKVESQVVYINMMIEVPESITKNLVYTHVSQNWKPENGKKTFYVEVTLEHPKLWREYFPSFSVRDIQFTGNIEIKGLWGEILPTTFWRHYRDACRAVLPGIQTSERMRYERTIRGYFNGSPYAFFAALQNELMKLIYQELPEHFPKYITVEPSDIEIVGVTGAYPQLQLGIVPNPLQMFPEVVKIILKTKIRADETMRTGTITVDIDELRKRSSQLIDNMRKNSGYWEEQVSSLGRSLKPFSN